MSKSKYFHAGASVLASLAFVGCASTPGPSSGAASTEATAFAKPTAEDIELISRAEPLAQVNYWNQQYNLHPVDPDVAMGFIRSLRQINSFERAAEVAGLAVVSHPENADFFVELGRANASQGKSREALRAFAKALEINPDDPYPFAAVGIILDREGQHENAQSAYAQALSRSPNRTTTLSNYGLSLALSGKLPEAENKLRKAAELPGATAKIRQNFALVLGLQGKFDEARSVAAQDAPNGIAERNTDFLAQMIGTSPQLQAISDIASAQDTPKPAPSQPVHSAALQEPLDQPKPAPQPQPEPRQAEPTPTATAQSAPASTTGRRRRARRSTLVTGGLD